MKTLESFSLKEKLLAASMVVVLASGGIAAGYGLGTAGDSSSEKPISTVTTEGEDGTPQLHGPYTVHSVIDGDTIRVEKHGAVEPVRLIGIDAPEVKTPYTEKECFGPEASTRTAALMEGASVYLARDDNRNNRDQYDRLLRYVYLDEDTHVNALLLREGYARELTFRDRYHYQEQFRRLEREAREQQAGLWSPNTCDGRTEPLAKDIEDGQNREVRHVEGCIPFTQAPDNIGARTCVTGIVDHVFVSGTDTTFINFCADYRTCAFSSVIFADDRTRFPEIADFEGRQIAVEGRIDTYQGRPQIILNDPEQLSLIQ